MKDLITEVIYDPETKLLDFTKVTSPDVYDQIFNNSLKDTLENQKLKVKHIKCTGSFDHKISVQQLQSIVQVLAKGLPKLPIVKTLDFSGNEKLNSSIAKNLNKLIKWKTDADLIGVSDSNKQILILNGMKLTKDDTLCHLFGKRLFKKNWINYIWELSLASMDISDDHFKAIDEDSFNLFRTMPFLRYLNLASKIKNKITI